MEHCLRSRPGSLMNGEACQVASPLSKVVSPMSKSSSNSVNPPPHSSLFSSSLCSLDYAFYKEDDEVDNLDIKLDVKRKSKRVYQSPAPDVNLKISR